jgi:hypothetical protein
MCKMIQDHWRLGEARRRFPDVDEETYESIAVIVKFKDQSLASGVSWAILQVGLQLISECVLLFLNIMPEQRQLHIALSGKFLPHQSKTISPLCSHSSTIASCNTKAANLSQAVHRND